MIPIIVEVGPERFLGEPTGRTQYRARRPTIGIYSAVIGRGYSEEEALDDFVRRANAESYTKQRITRADLVRQDPA